MHRKTILFIILFTSLIIIGGCVQQENNLEQKCCEECLSAPNWDKPSCWVGLNNNDGSNECIEYFKDNPHMISDCESIVE